MAYIGSKRLFNITSKGDSAFIRYSSDADGTDFTEQWIEGQNYIGFATGQTAPTDKSDYEWVFVGGSPGSGGGEINTDELDERYVQQYNSKGAVRLYGVNRQGAQTMFLGGDVDGAFLKDRIPTYVDDKYGKTEPTGALPTKTPVNDYHAATKKYVDDNSGWKQIQDTFEISNTTEPFVISSGGALVAVAIKEPWHTSVAILHESFDTGTGACGVSTPIYLYNRGWAYIECTDGACIFKSLNGDEQITIDDNAYVTVYAL